MNSLTAEKKYQFTKWAELIKECKSSGLKVSEWLKENNISKDQYYYWQRKLKDACLESMQSAKTTFVELPAEISHTKDQMPVIKKAIVKATETNSVITPVASLKINNINIDIYDNATPDFLRNIAEAFMYVE